MGRLPVSELTPDSTSPPPKPVKKTLKNVWFGGLGLLSLLYILNPGAGIFELIPDNLPLLGNLDEATAVALLLASLRYYGVDLTGWVPWFKSGKTPPK
ncbi:MAG: DUF1232 domain-containing protein [Candidatus Sericytochromatia bacterium]|nr:DUF1232 domain-containing protein [Candidatus Sericytochromatia bacterium]